jgi:hypothetical protein
VNASASVGLGDIMAEDWPNTPVLRQKKRLRVLRSPLESSERPTAIVGQSSSEKSRFKSIKSQSGRGTSSLQTGTITT